MDFNTRISAFFLRNNRLTVLAFLFLLMLGIGSTSLLKTTGFPSPDLKFVGVQTFYFGASSETVEEEVTAPLEAALRDVDGVHSFTSTSSNSFSFIGVTVDESADTDSVISKINSTLGGVTLPEGVEEPEVTIPSISGPDILYSLVSKNEEDLYAHYEELEKKLLELPETAEVSPLTAVEKRLLVTLDEEKMAAAGVTAAQVQATLASFGESLPVASDLALDGKNQSLLTRLDEGSIKDVENLKFGTVKLKDFADIELNYEFEDGKVSMLGLNVGGDAMVLKALHFEIKAVKNTDIADYTEAIENVVSDLGNLQLVKNFDVSDGFDKTLMVEDYSVNNDNERQVEEVVTGLVGAELENVDTPWAYAGWLLGGIQLVFLVMVLFVSWRAAVIAALAIPMSLVFSTIYIYAIGENLNTLVLFSLVLAIGLVVDPALVLLESVQRKVDIGLRGKEAAIAAVKDVGMGLFLACLTSIIVFLPFGVVSGILGQIITYIPMTIIPAVVGSYIVPLVFLAWMGGLFLKPKRGKSADEEENLWGIAKLVVSINEWILNHSRILRFLIVVVALVVPIMVAGYYFQSGKVKSVQFASSDNADYLQLGFVHYSDTPADERASLEKKVLKAVAENEAVLGVFPMPGDIYMAALKPAIERGDYLSIDAAEDITENFGDLQEEFFDLKVGVISNGPPAGDYQITLALKSSDLDALAESAEVVGEKMLDLCYTDGVYSVDASCEGESIVTKVDNGYEGKESTVIEVILDREKLNELNLTIPGAPLTAYVNSVLRSLFSVNNGDSVGKITVDGKEIDIVLEKEKEDPDSLTEIKNTVIFVQGETVLRLKDIATIEEKESQASIQRVNGETVSIVKARLITDRSDETSSALAAQAVLDYYEENSLEDNVEIEQYSEGDTAGFLRSFQELFTALILAIVITYVVLVMFFESFSQPLVILYTIPLTFLGVFPALAAFGGGQFGFLEIIGLIILVGIVENVAIFLIDAAKQKIREGWDDVRAISYASGIRFRAVLLTKLTALASLAPLAVLSEQYRSISLVIMFGLLTSGITSLFTTPILFIFFRWLSAKVHGRS